MFWEALSQPTEWVIAISCKSYCLTKGCSIFYPQPIPRMVCFWKEGFSFSSKTVHTKKNPWDFIFQRALAQIWALWIPAILTAGKGGSDKKWMSQVLHFGSLRRKCLQLSYCTKVRVGAKKKMEGGRGGEKRKCLPRNPAILENTPW